MSSSPEDTTHADDTKPPATKRGWRFWLIFLALCLSLFLTALDLASVYTALPSIIHDLQGADSFVWVSSAYTLSCAAVLPMSGRLADIFGRRAVLLVAILLFAAGSAVTAAATTMGTIILGRTIQGVGSGAIQVLVAIVTADLIPLKDRGFFQSITGATFSFASATGPFIAGALSQHATWRWLFYLNLPLCGLAFVVVFVFLRLRKPPIESYKKAFLAVDWIGNAILIASAASCIVGLTWAGIRYPWSSAQVIAPLVVGILGLFGALVYDAYVASHPVIPTAIIKHRTTLGGYIGSFFHIMVANSITCDPTYFQAAKVAPPLLSGLYIFPTVICISPSAILQGIIVSKTGRYRFINFLGWCGMTTGVGLLTLLKASSPIPLSIPFQALAAIGVGFVYSTTFSVLAPLPPTQNAAALSFLLFMRTFSSAWASSITGTVFQNRLRAALPRAFLALVPPGQDVTYAGIPLIARLPEGSALQDAVREAFAESLHTVWYISLGLCAAGFASVALQTHVPLHSKMDERFGMKGGADGKASPAAAAAAAGERDAEKGEGGESFVPVQADSTPAERESALEKVDLGAVLAPSPRARVEEISTLQLSPRRDGLEEP
ncbi:Mfs1.1 [Trametes punicea]|nr:Mfs1.1 [Trametes punicea]